MKTIVITGQSNSGKSRAIYLVATRLNQSYIEKTELLKNSFDYASHPYVPNQTDLMALFSDGATNILVHAATDDETCITRLKENLDDLKSKGVAVDVLITTCRRFDDSTSAKMDSIMGWQRDGHTLLDSTGY